MQAGDIKKYIQIYSKGLLEDTLSFWLKHSIDEKYGGFIFSLDRDGSILDTDKPMWIQSRFVWLLSTLYNTVEKKQQWLDLAKHGIDFIEKYGFDKDGRMFFRVTQDGKGLIKRRYLYSEFFAVLGFAAYAQAAGEESYKEKAVELFEMIQKYLNTLGLLLPKGIPGVRDMKNLAIPMMIICVCQQLKNVVEKNYCDKHIDNAIAEIESHINDQYRCVLENVGPNGEFIDHFDGRIVTPGHGIEAAWFILHEALCRDRNLHLINLGCKMVDYCWQIGWDKKYGGILYFKDARGLPVSEYWHDMKFWWPQNETIIATLLAYYLTGDEKYANWHKVAHDWAYRHFPDKEFGEWFGYLHRDGRLSNTIKGNMWKGPFHLPRMQWYCWKLLQKMEIKKNV
ncbi:MAG: N-acylglucosamine 2-epimerase [Planctomycetes bacterium GWF2_42_9]|nr:MAG: N-acylglucosamine 2-epimerase [Planctomycetes bacterium GWF2_42_9]